MEIPGRISLFCPLIDAKGTPATLLSVASEGYYEVEVAIKGARHTMFVPIAGSAFYFSDPEPERSADFEVER